MKTSRTVATFAAAAIALFFVSCAADDGRIVGSGTIEATTITVVARTSGEVLEMAAAEGLAVTKGQELAQVDATASELELARAEQNVAVFEAQLELLLAGAREEDLRQARANVEQASQSLDLAERSYTRATTLFESGSTTSSDLDQARTQYELARSRETAARAALDKLIAFARPEEVRIAEARLAGARASVAQIQNRISDTTIQSPIDGIVLIRAREPGEYVAPGAALYQLADLSTVHLTVYIPGPALAAIRLNESVHVTVDGMAETVFDGRVSRIADQAEFTPKNAQTSEARSRLVYAVEITLENPDGVFKIGMPADAEFVKG